MFSIRSLQFIVPDRVNFKYVGPTGGCVYMYDKLTSFDFCCLYNSVMHVGASGQPYGVTIEASSTTSYTVGDNITLTRVVDSSIASNSSNISYIWTCSRCFADGTTTPIISHHLTSMDSSMIDCSATVDGVIYMTEIPFCLQVTQGSYYL